MTKKCILKNGYSTLTHFQKAIVINVKLNLILTIEYRQFILILDLNRTGILSRIYLHQKILTKKVLTYLT